MKRFLAVVVCLLCASCCVASAQNLYNASATSNGFINGPSGALYQPGDQNYCYPSTPIAVQAGAVYKTTQMLLGDNGGLAFYSNGTFVSGTNASTDAGGTVTIPNGVNGIEFVVLCSASPSESFTLLTPAVNMGTTATNVAAYNVIFGANNAIPTTGDHDTVYGVNAGMSLTSAREMTIVGAQACQSFTGFSSGGVSPENGLSTCIGSYAGSSLVANGGPFVSIDDTFVGQKSGASMTAGDSEVTVGAHAGIDIGTGNHDTVVGAHSMDASGLLNSQQVTVVGAGSLNAVGDKSNLVVVGASTVQNLGAASQDVFIGTNGEGLTSATQTILIGDLAGFNGPTVSDSVIVGFQAAPFTPSYSVIIGDYAGLYATAPGTLVGSQAGNQVTTGYDNTCIGAGSCGGLHTGLDNVAVGKSAGGGWSGSESLNVAIGAGATTTQGANNAAQIGFGNNPTSNSLQFLQTQVVDTNGDLHVGTSAPGASDTCAPGAVRVVMPYIYACVAPNQWMRATLNSY